MVNIIACILIAPFLLCMAAFFIAAFFSPFIFLYLSEAPTGAWLFYIMIYLAFFGIGLLMLQEHEHSRSKW